MSDTPQEMDTALERLARKKRFDLAWLQSLGVKQGPGCDIHVTYFDEAGTALYHRVRREIAKKTQGPHDDGSGAAGSPGEVKSQARFLSPGKGTKEVPYGLWRLADERRRGVILFVTEGETDTLALWHHRLPALGIPGNTRANLLRAEDLIGFEKLYVCVDVLRGKVFVDGMCERLGQLGYQGEVLAITMPPDRPEIEDTCDLHAADPDGFLEAWAERVAVARVLEIPKPAAPPRAGLRGATGVPAAPPERRWEFRPVTLADLRRTVKPPEWLVERLLVWNQPIVIGGPSKSLKTSLSIDLAVSLANGLPFLNSMAVPKRRKTMLLSGESGEWTIMTNASKIAESKGLDPDTPGDDLSFMFKLPYLSDAIDLLELAKGIEGMGVEVCIIDPLYLCLAGPGAKVEPSNMYSVGPLLAAVSESLLRVGCTPILVHHATKPASRNYDPLTLEDLAFSGISQFCRQWLMINRREPFEPGVSSKLWLAGGGSASQSGLWAVNVDEGILDRDFNGKEWRVSVESASAARQSEKDALAARVKSQKQDTMERRMRSYLDALDTLAVESADEGWVLANRVEAHLSINNEVAKTVIKNLADFGIIEIDKDHPNTDKRGRARPPALAVRRIPEGGDQDAN